jgi:succinate dehydrogenase/fumarate reductase flavoprotein subunit
VYTERSLAEFSELGQRTGQGPTPGAVQNRIQDLMWDTAGPFRSGESLRNALETLSGFRSQLKDLTISPGNVFNLDLQDWYELKAMLRTSEAVVTAALNRAESRGAHQRTDIPQTIAGFEKNQRLALTDGTLSSGWTSVVRCLA